MDIEYTKDINGKMILQTTTNEEQIMMEWEKPYMEQCIQKLNPYGEVLEIGFGLGYSATEIQSHPNVTKHTIIECSPEVWPKLEEFKNKHGKMFLERVECMIVYFLMIIH